MASKDLYETLGVAREADAAALKSAYRKLAMKYHPDQNPGDKAAEDKFKDINEAYSILSDAEKRAAYDRYGMAAFQNGAGGGGQGYSDFRDVFSEMFGDVFSEAFGRPGGRSRSGPQRGADLRYDLDLTLEEAFAGKDSKIEVPSLQPCVTCDSTGAAPGTKVDTCTMCRGAGRVRATQGFFTVERTCPTCHGAGQTIASPCKSCAGQGAQRVKRTLSVQIPPGVDTGTRIRLTGEGEPGARGGPRGDLYVIVTIIPHSLFERDGPNLFCRASVPMVTAALGGEIETPTIEGGRVKIKIPEGAQTGKKMRLRGEGMSQLRARERGDLVVELFVETPTKLTLRQREILEEFRQESCADCYPEHESFVGKAKKFWQDLSG